MPLAFGLSAAARRSCPREKWSSSMDPLGIAPRKASSRYPWSAGMRTKEPAPRWGRLPRFTARATF